MGNLCIKSDTASNSSTASNPQTAVTHNTQKDVVSNDIHAGNRTLKPSWTAMRGEEALSTNFKIKRARNNVFNATIDFSQAPKIKEFAKSETQREQLRDCLKDNFLFAGISEMDLDLLVKAAQVVPITKGQEVIKQGDAGDYFYIVESGMYQVVVDGKTEPVSLGPGKAFGELALMYNTPRAASVQALTNGAVFQLDRDTFRYTIANSVESKHKEAVSILKTVSILRGLEESQFDEIADAVEMRTFKEGTIIFHKGQTGKIFYMIKDGKVKITDLGSMTPDVKLKAGDHFGERALLTGEPRVGTAVAETTCHVMMIDRELFAQKLGSIQHLMAKNLSMRALCNNKIFENLSDAGRRRLLRSFEEVIYKPGEKIIKEGEAGDKFYVIFGGTAIVQKGGNQVSELNAGDHFGETALINSSDKRNATVIAKSKVDCFVLDRSTFEFILASVKTKLEQEASYRTVTRKTLLDDGVDYSKSSLNDFKRLGILGSGTFGRVTLEKHKKTGKLYALKAMLKSELVAQKQQVNVCTEKKLMIQCVHPFILRLYHTFKDSKRLYMLLDFVQGGELFTVIHTPQRDGLPMASSKFYAAGVLLGLAYLHHKNIAYRDMKPENCLVDAQGYPKLVDFGFSKIIEKKSYTLCGTPEYLAPELVYGRGHDKSVDYWAFGILIYELTVGYSPFCDPSLDQTIICRNIVSGKLSFPSQGFGKKGVYDPKCKDIVKKLLVRDSKLRLGNLQGGVDDIFHEHWFSEFNFEKMMDKTIKAPWVPAIKNPEDMSHFDGIDDHAGDGAPYTDTSGWENEF